MERPSVFAPSGWHQIMSALITIWVPFWKTIRQRCAYESLSSIRRLIIILLFSSRSPGTLANNLLITQLRILWRESSRNIGIFLPFLDEIPVVPTLSPLLPLPQAGVQFYSWEERGTVSGTVQSSARIQHNDLGQKPSSGVPVASPFIRTSAYIFYILFFIHFLKN